MARPRLRHSPRGPMPGVDEVQAILGPGHAHVRQAALLLELPLVVEARA